MTTATALPAPFTWCGAQIAIDLPGGHGRFTTRRPGAAGAPIDLAQGPDALAAELRLRPDAIAMSPQVHGAQVRIVATDADLCGPAPDADGQVTAIPGVACTVRVADCLPVLLIAPEAVGALHAGWRGLAAGILEAGVGALRALGASAIQAAIGPGARVCCYETGEEVHAAFARFGTQARRGTHADLAFVARATLEAAGVDVVHDVRLCTICAPAGLLWSHRREGTLAGRQGGAAWRS